MISDAAGNLRSYPNAGRAGMVYELDAANEETTPLQFSRPRPARVSGPFWRGVILDSAGNLYGTAVDGGPADAGVLYKMGAAGQETVLHSFTGADGGAPSAGVIADPAGNFYGTAYSVVFELSATGNYMVLHTFRGAPTAFSFRRSGSRAKAGNLYGTGPRTAEEQAAEDLAAVWCTS